MSVFSELSFNKLYNQVTNYLKLQYKKSDKVFRTSSPFGQILKVILELFQLNILYQKNSITQWDISNPINNNLKTIRGLAVLSGHNPHRATTSTGTIKLTINNDIIISDEIKGSVITIFDRTKIINSTTNIPYVIELGNNTFNKYNITKDSSIYLNILQGEWKSQFFTGTGLSLQSFVIPNSTSDDIDNDKFLVYVNGVLFERKDNLYSLLPNENSYFAKNSISGGGIDIYFGTGDFGVIPQIGSIIEVQYLLTSGSIGNIIDGDVSNFTFIDSVIDGLGNEVSMDTLFSISVSTPIDFGTDGESLEFTKALLPLSKGGLTLTRPEHFVYHLKRLGIFSIVEAYTNENVDTTLIDNISVLLDENVKLLKDNNDANLKITISSNLRQIEILQKQLLINNGTQAINIMCIPNVNLLYGKTKSINYFEIPLDAFIFDDVEKGRLLAYLKNSGKLSLKSVINIVTPIQKKYVLNVIVRIFENNNEDNIRTNIIAKISDYMLNQNRIDRIPPSDFINIIEDITGVDSADCKFINEDTEKYHREYNIKKIEFYNKNLKNPTDDEIIMNDGKIYDSSKLIGIDNILGDAIINKNELFMIRGGFYDRNDNYYNDTLLNSVSYNPINVLILKDKSKKR